MWLAQAHLPIHPRAILGAFDFASLCPGMELRDVQTFADAPVWSPPKISRDQIAPRERVMAQKNLESFTQPSRSDLRDLIGLGEGLTPAGDDFVGGFLFAQWHLRAAYPDSITWDQSAVNALLAYARPRTNAISYAILCDHARGQSAAPMHDLVIALLTGKAAGEIARHTNRVLAIGNTSGREMLAGIRAAFDAWLA